MTRHRPYSVPAGLRHLAWNDTGAALVEFTLLAPFLISLAFGMAEFGRFLYHYQLVVEGLRDAGRYIARLDPNLCPSRENAANLAVFGTIDGTGQPRVAGWTVDDVDVVVTDIPNAGTYRGPDTIYTVKVTTTFNYADVGLLSALGLPALSVTASHEQRVIDRVDEVGAVCAPAPEEA